MISTPINEMRFETILDLKANRVSEGRTMEYKLETPKKHSFLAAVSAFANTDGGYLLIGVKESRGVPADLPGTEIKNLDEKKQQIENMLLSCVEPPLTPNQNYTIKAIPVPNKDDHYILVIQIHRSWRAPHRVNSSRKFYRRGFSRLYELDVDELRAAFTLHEIATERIRGFRSERLAAVDGHDIPVPLEQGARMIFHLVPLSAFATRRIVDIINCPIKISPLVYDSVTEERINLDGIITFQVIDVHARAYTQLFRNGVAEGVFVLGNKKPQQPWHLGYRYESKIIDFLEQYFTFADQVDLAPPYYAFLSFAGVKGYKLLVGDARDDEQFSQDSLRMNELRMPEIEISDHNHDAATILQPVFNMVWNAFGYRRSGNYDAEGEREHDDIGSRRRLANAMSKDRK